MFNKKILGGALLAGGAYAIYKYQQIQAFKENFKAYIVGFKLVPGVFKNSNYTKLDFNMLLALENYSTLNIDIEAIQINVYVDALILAKIKSTKTFNIRANKKTTFNNLVNLDIKTLPGAVALALQKALASNELELIFKGLIITKYGNINFTQTKIFTF
jgi:hypothetical protein